ncbi:MAG: dihydroorotase [Fibrobacterota bacterium]
MPERKGGVVYGVNKQPANCIIKNGRILDPRTKTDRIGDVAIENGRIAAFPQVPEGFSAEKIIDAENMWVVPGLIDIHVHLREPGGEHKETIESGTAAAAAGGFTGVACMPNTSPVTDTEAKIRYIKQRSRLAPCKVYPVGSMTKGLNGDELSPYGEMIKAGAAAVSDDGKSIYRSDLLKNALNYARMFTIPVVCHCEDRDLAQGGAMDESSYSIELGIPGIPAISEDIDVERHIAIAEYTNTPIHICHVSSAGAVRIIANAKKRGVRVTAETAPHYLWYTNADVGYDTNRKMNPPLRGEKDRTALLEGLRRGTLDIIASDHAPHTVEDKDGGFDTASFGVVGLESTVGATLTQLVHSGKFSPLEWVYMHSTKPAQILRIPGGSLEPGSAADITIINPDEEWNFNPRDCFTKGRNSAFENENFTGRVLYTLLDGECVYEKINK